MIKTDREMLQALADAHGIYIEDLGDGFVLLGYGSMNLVHRVPEAFMVAYRIAHPEAARHPAAAE